MTYELFVSEEFDNSFDDIREYTIRSQIDAKILQLKINAFLGKKLKGSKYWSLRVNKYRVIYFISGNTIQLMTILKRKHDYKELSSINIFR